MDKQPFTKEEQEVMDLLVEAHMKFIKLPRTHVSERDEWILSFHKIQNLLCMRTLRRDYPKYFSSISENNSDKKQESICTITAEQQRCVYRKNSMCEYQHSCAHKN